MHPAGAGMEWESGQPDQRNCGMIVHKLWKARRKLGAWKNDDIWLREGWFLFGFIPLYIRDRQEREAK